VPLVEKLKTSLRPTPDEDLSDSEMDLDPVPEDPHSLLYLCYKINETPEQERRRNQKEKEERVAARKEAQRIRKREERLKKKEEEVKASDDPLLAICPGQPSVNLLPSLPGSCDHTSSGSSSRSSSRRSSICSVSSAASSQLSIRKAAETTRGASPREHSKPSSRCSSVCSSSGSVVKTPDSTPLWARHQLQMPPLPPSAQAAQTNMFLGGEQSPIYKSLSKGHRGPFGGIVDLLGLVRAWAHRLEGTRLSIRQSYVLDRWASRVRNEGGDASAYDLAEEAFNQADRGYRGVVDSTAAMQASEQFHRAMGVQRSTPEGCEGRCPFLQGHEYDLASWLFILMHSGALAARSREQLRRGPTRVRCACGAWMIRHEIAKCYQVSGGLREEVRCDFSGDVVRSSHVWHCPRGRAEPRHPNGFDVDVANTVRYRRFVYHQMKVADEWSQHQGSQHQTPGNPADASNTFEGCRAGATPRAPEGAPEGEPVGAPALGPPLPRQFQPLPQQLPPLPPQIRKSRRKRMDGLQTNSNMAIIDAHIASLKTERRLPTFKAATVALSA